MATLIENLHSYVDTILELMLNTLSSNPNIESIDEIILKYSIEDFEKPLKSRSEQSCDFPPIANLAEWDRPLEGYSKSSIDMSAHLELLNEHGDDKCSPENYLEFLFGPK